MSSDVFLKSMAMLGYVHLTIFIDMYSEVK